MTCPITESKLWKKQYHFMRMEINKHWQTRMLDVPRCCEWRRSDWQSRHLRVTHESSLQSPSLSTPTHLAPDLTTHTHTHLTSISVVIHAKLWPRATPVGDTGPHLTHGPPDSYKSTPPNGISISSAVLTQSHSDRLRYNGHTRPHLMLCTALWTNNSANR